MSISGTVWDLEPHTAKKHEILRRYFQAWLPILAQSNERLLYVDAFAGPGKYSKGEDGSPLVVLKAARDHVVKFRSELLCLFVESENDRYEHLVKVLNEIKPTLPANIKFRPLQGRFNEHLSEILTELDEQKRHKAPTLAFVDPFGFSQIPFKDIARLMRYPKCEVFVNFMYDEINRFLSFPNFAQHFDSLFGLPEWRKVLNVEQPIDRFVALYNLYREQLKKVARYIRAFLMLNKFNTPDYLLFFATDHLAGLEAMKQAMWKADPSGEFEFSDFTDAKNQRQPLLFEATPPYHELQEMIESKFNRTEIAIEVLSDWVVSDTPFLRTHLKRQVLVPMEKEGAVNVVKSKPGRRKYTYPDGTILKFR